MMNYAATDKKHEFLQSVKVARDERAYEKRKEKCATLLQATVRGWLIRRKYRLLVLSEFDEFFTGEYHSKSAENAFRLIRRFLGIRNDCHDRERFVNLCRYVTKSLEEECVSRSYAGIFLLKEHSVSWINQLKEILKICNLYLKTIHTDSYADSTELHNSLIIFLHTAVSLTSINTWKVYNSSALKDVNILKPGLHQLCNNAVGYLMKQNFYATLREILCKSFTPVYGQNKITLTNTCLMAIMILACRPMLYSDFVDDVVAKFSESILTVPALIHHVHCIAPQFFSSFDEEQLLRHLTNFLNNCRESVESTQSCHFTVPDLSVNNDLLCFVANFVALGKIYLELIAKKEFELNFITALSFLLDKCRSCIKANRSSNLTQWHPILGWFMQDAYDASIHESLPLIKRQLSSLWSKHFITLFLENPLQSFLDQIDADPSMAFAKVNIGKKALSLLTDVTNLTSRWKTKRANSSSQNKMAVYEIQRKLMVACMLYHTTINTFVQLRLDILTGLCYQSNALIFFWKYFLSQPNGLKFLYRYVSNSSPSSSPPSTAAATTRGSQFADDVNCQILLLFSECMIHYVTILDDVEMYEQQTLFSLGEFVQLSAFLNYFLYKGIINDVFRKDDNDEIVSQIFTSLHKLLMILHLRDCRRPYATSKTHWIIKEIKSSSFFHDLEKNNKKIMFLKECMPHVVPYHERVNLLKKKIMAEKYQLRESLFQPNDRSMGFISSSNCSIPRLVKIRRNHIVEDAFLHLHELNPVDIKQSFRVKFFNKAYLEEAGVDQAGIFKEFIVDVIQKLFDPSLNLFRRTVNGHVYPSLMTSMSEANHLNLVEFSGKMLAKALFEGIVLDVRLASFFLSQIVGQTQSTSYSYLDELPSLDDELYRSLMYVKRYEGDVADLCLTFSTTEEYFGTVVTRELIPGGKAIGVTNQNKIIYVHLMAHFRMYTQIKQQTMAFAKGFYSLLSRDSIAMFSVPELQLLISGEDEPLNFEQLRNHTQYYGGFHNSHKVIVWLWDILENDFNEEERCLFLKFVTSSPKPPILGFASLNPPFSIRCVEVSEDDDPGDSVGSVIRGFFTIRRKGPEHRLPTSSTCFNLLKLPNYSHKSILRDKLRYAITANSGFELS